MNNATAALLALVLVCSLPGLAIAGAAGGEVPGDVTQAVVETDDAADEHVNQHLSQTSTQFDDTFTRVEDTTNRLLIDDERERAHASPEPDFATSVANADDELRVDADRHAFEEAFDGAADPEARADLIAEYRALIHDHVRALDEREEAAVTAHADGDLSDTQLLRTILRNYNEANELAAFNDALNEHTGQIPGESPDNELQWKIATHQSDMRAELEAAATYGHETVVTVETHESGYRLSTVAGGSYLHETTRFDLRDRDADADGLSFGEAEEHAADRYPWALSNANSYRFHAAASPNFYLTEISHDHGELYGYIDGVTEEVTREHQLLAVNSLPTTEADSVTEDGLELTVNTTAASGPVEVSVADEDGDPVEGASIAIGEDDADWAEVGETDEEGTVWIAPPVGAYDVQAEDGLDTVTVTIDD